MSKLQMVTRFLLLSLMATLVVGISAGSPKLSKSKLSPDLVEGLPWTDPDTYVPVIVQTDGPVTWDDVADVYDHDGDLWWVFDTESQSYLAELPAGMIKSLAKKDRIKHISPDREVLLAATSWEVAATKADIARTAYGVNGAGVGIAVLDSGVDPHEDLIGAGRLVAWRDFTSSTTDFVDGNGHGTHVAGIAAGDGTCSATYSTKFDGMAPGANIIGVKVLSSTGAGNVSNVIAGIDWCVANKAAYNIRVLNLSLGHRVRETYTTDPLCQAVERAWKAGIVVVVAAGNEGRGTSSNPGGYGTIDSPGNDPFVITVGATNTKRTFSTTDDVMATYSGHGPSVIDHILKPDIVAPGNRYISLRNTGGSLDTSYPGNKVTTGSVTRYFVLSGTSMATPVVAGAVALMLQQDSTLTPDTVKARLMVSANSLVKNPNGSRASVFIRGAGSLDVNAALSFAPGQIIPTGYAWSPKCYRGTTGGLFKISTAIFGGPTNNLWNTLSGSNALWADSEVSGADEGIFGNNALWADVVDEILGNNALWADNSGDESMWSNSTIWGSNALWSDDAAMADCLTILAFGDEGDL